MHRIDEGADLSTRWVRWFGEVGIGDVALVGGKNASLGEMTGALTEAGVRIPEGFALTAEAYWSYLEENGIKDEIAHILQGLDKKDVDALSRGARRIRSLVMGGQLPDDIAADLSDAYAELGRLAGADDIEVAVRSSATAEDQMSEFQPGEVLVTTTTNPDWEPIMRWRP